MYYVYGDYENIMMMMAKLIKSIQWEEM